MEEWREEGRERRSEGGREKEIHGILGEMVCSTYQIHRIQMAIHHQNHIHREQQREGMI